MPGDILRCSRCRTPLAGEAMLACISGAIMGDEYTDYYYFCAACQVYTVRTLRDHFLGPESVQYSAPIAKSDGDAKVRLIQACTRPWDGRCRCDSHRAHFGGWLD